MNVKVTVHFPKKRITTEQELLFRLINIDDEVSYADPSIAYNYVKELNDAKAEIDVSFMIGINCIGDTLKIYPFSELDQFAKDFGLKIKNKRGKK